MYMSNSMSSSVTSPNISIRVSKEDLIAMMGVDRIAVENELTIWSELGFIKNDEGWITVNDSQKLAEVIEQEV